MNEIKKTIKVRKDSNRLRLSNEVMEKANKWLSQLETEFNGMLNLKKNDLINFLLEEYDNNLSQNLMEKIKEKKLTDKQKAKWIYQKFLDAEKQGLKLNLNDLIKTAQSPSKRKRKARKTKNTALTSTENNDSQNNNLSNNNN